ncbi:YadA-like family protein [Phascolarctobacterium succinatutens]|uniref:YadA-like family protein n=2 Tax=Phascolarctobacterium succinatutens TaxID=626940 RepID=UPI003AEF999B
MTRKKSNVKALALAVTCAILAGGGIGLEPVYAMPGVSIKVGTNANYDSIGKELKYEYEVDSSTTIYTRVTELTVGGVTIGGTGGDAGQIIANKIVGTGGSNPSAISINGATFADGGAITATGLKLGTDYDVKEKIDKNIENITTNKNALQALTEDGGRISSLEGRVGTNETNIVALETKTANLSANGKKLTNMEEVGATKLAVGGKEITADTVARYDAAVSKTTNITYDAATQKTYINKGTDQQVVIDAKGLKVGKNTSRMNDITGFATSKNLYVGTTDADNPTAADSKFFVDGATGETVVNGTGGKTTITGGGITIDSAVGNQHVLINSGTVNATTSVISPDFFVDHYNDFKKNSLKVGDGTKGVTIEDGAITTTGDATVGGTLGVTGNITGTDITATGALKGASLNVTNDATVGGTLGVTGNITGTDITATGVLKGASLNVTGNATVGGTLGVTGNITGTDITATGVLKGASLNVTNNATVGGTLGVAGATTLGSTLEVTSDTTLHGALNAKGKATFGNAPGALTEIDGDKLKTGVIETNLTQESNIGGVKMSNGKITASNMEITGAISLNDLTVKNKLTVGAFSVDKTGAVTSLQSINGVAVAKSGTGLTIGSATIGDANPFSSTGFTVDANGNVAAQNITAGTYNGNTIGADNKFNGVELKGGNVAATKVTAGTITDGIATMTGGKVTANEIAATSASLAGVTFDTNGVDFNNKDIKNVANVTAKTADLGNLHIEGHVIKNNVDAGGPIGLGTTVTVNNAGELGGITKIDGVNVTDDAGGLAIGTGATQVTIGGANAISVGAGTFTVDSAGLVTGKQFTTTNGSYLKDNELKLNYANIWNTTEGLKAEKAVIGANTLDTAGISTTGTLGVEGVATFGKDAADQTKITQGKAEFTQGGKTTTIKGGEIETDKLTVNDIVLKNSMKDGAGNTITIKGSDGSMSVAGGKFAVDDKGQMTNEYTGYDAAGRTTKTTLKTSVDGINANYTNSVNNNNNLLNINQDGVALGVTDSSNNNLGMLSADANAATMGYGTANSIVVNEDTIKSALGTDVTRVMTNSATEQSIVDKVGAASRSLTANQIVDVAGGMTITTNSNGTTFGNNTANNTLIYGSAITSTNGAATGVLDGSNLTLTNGANKTVLDAGKVTYTGKAGYSNTAGTQTTIDGGIITTDTLKVQRIQLGEKIVDQRTGETIGSGVTLASDGGFTAAGGNFKVTGGTTGSKGSIKNVVGDATNGKTAFETNQQGANMSFEKGGIKSEVAVADDSAKISAGASSIEVKNDGITNNGVTTFNGITGTTTKIDGGTITTNHLITDKLTITGSGNADGTGSTTGSIAFGGNGSITSNIKDAATGKEATFKTDEKGTFTEAKDSAGNKTTNTVNAQGNTNEVTDGTNTSTATQTATSIGGVVTNGTVKMKQELTAEGVKVTDELGDPANYTQITNKDVSITDPKNTGERIKLSDLGQLKDLDGELNARSEYTSNETAVGAINAEAAIRREEVARLDGRINDVNDRVNKVGAMAAAIASLKSIGYDPQAPSEFSIGLGQYKGETGVAMGFFHYPNKNFMINVSLSTAGGETMGGIGATWRFGHKSPQKLLEEQREEQAKKELAAAEKYQAAAKLAKEAQERAEYAAKLARQAQVSADNAKAAADATQAKHFG